MEVKVFVDVLFITNFIIDYILLSITSFFVKKRPKIFKMCAASSFGAIFAAGIFFVQQNIIFLIFSSACVAFLMVFLAFGKTKATTLLKNTAIFYMICTVIAGFSFSFISIRRNNNGIAFNNGIIYADIDAYTMLLIFIVSVVTIHTATGYIRKQKIKSNYLYNVTIEKNGRTISDTALFDSGNFMCDPISQKSVVIAEWQSVSPLFDENKITECIVNHPKDFLYIGCRGLSGISGMYAFSPDKISSFEIDFPEPVLIAITQTPLDKEGGYRMLLPNTSTASISKKGY